MRFLPLVLGVALTAGACGNGSTEVGAGGPSRPTGPGEVVVQVLVDGGFRPREATLATVPATTILGDGTVITQAPVLAIYPGPALAPLQSAKVDGAAVDRLVRRAGDLGLLTGPLEFGQPPVADAANTTVTIVAGGRTHRHVAYALGIVDGTTGGTARKALSEFLVAVDALPAGGQTWDPGAVLVRVAGPYVAEPQLPQPPVTWPLATVPAVPAGSQVACMVVEGDDLRRLKAPLAKANAATPWVIAGVARSVVFVPVVPGGPTCGG